MKNFQHGIFPIYGITVHAVYIWSPPCASGTMETCKGNNGTRDQISNYK